MLISLKWHLVRCYKINRHHMGTCTLLALTYGLGAVLLFIFCTNARIHTGAGIAGAILTELCIIFTVAYIAYREPKYTALA